MTFEAMSLESFHFLRPAALLLALPALFVWWRWRRHADPLRGWRAQIEPELLAALVDGGDARPRRHLALLAGWLLAVLALAGPAWRPEPSPFAEDATPLVVLLAADTRMDVADPAPSRMRRAQLEVADLAEARRGQPLGLVTYAGSAHLVLPPTRDTAVVADMAAEITPDVLPEAGDRLDLAIERAADLLDGGSLLVVTDTAASSSAAIEAAHRAAGSPPVLLLAIAPPGASLEPLRPLADALDADLVAMTDDDEDTRRILRGAARPPVARDAEGEVRWRDEGYGLLPLLALLALLPFRREAAAAPTS